MYHGEPVFLLDKRVVNFLLPAQQSILETFFDLTMNSYIAEVFQLVGVTFDVKQLVSLEVWVVD